MTPTEHCVAWLREFITPIKSFNHRRGSYGLKHDVEQWCQEYIPMDALIAAADELGYRKQTIAPGSINYFFNMSFKRRPIYFHSRELK